MSIEVDCAFHGYSIKKQLCFPFFFFFNLFTCWLCWVFVAAPALLWLRVQSWCMGFLLRWLLLLQSLYSILVTHGFSCSVACGIFPDQGSNLCLLHWQAGSLPPSHRGSPLFHFLSVSSDCQIINLFYSVHSWNEHSQPVLPKYLKIKSLTHNGRFFTMKTESVTHPNRSYGNYNQFSLALISKTGLIIRPWKHLMSICYLSGIDHSCCMYPAYAPKSCRLI